MQNKRLLRARITTATGSWKVPDHNVADAVRKALYLVEKKRWAVKYACSFCGISQSTFHRWMKK